MVFPSKSPGLPVDQHARRIPVLASDCDKFVYLGMPTPEKESVHPILYAGDFLGSPSQKVIVDASVVRGNGPQAVTITRGSDLLFCIYRKGQSRAIKYS